MVCLDYIKINKCKVTLLTKNYGVLKFNNLYHKKTVQFAIYSDIECLLMEYTDSNVKSNKTTYFQNHELFSIAYYLKCLYDDLLSQYNY